MNVLIVKGYSIYVIDKLTFDGIKYKPKLSHGQTRVFAHGSDSAKFIGKYYATIESDHKITAPVYLIKGNLLCYETYVDLSIVPVLSSLVTNLQYY